MNETCYSQSSGNGDKNDFNVKTTDWLLALVQFNDA